MLVHTFTGSGDSNSVVFELSSSCSGSQGCGTESQETDSSSDEDEPPAKKTLPWQG